MVMKIQMKQQDKVHVLELDGEVDFHSSPELREKLQVALNSDTKKILVNLRKVTYIDSSGLATFVEALQKIKKTGGTLVLSELVPAVRSVFEIAKLDSIFSLASSDEEAVGILSN